MGQSLARSTSAAALNAVLPPVAKRIPKYTEIHGVTLTDDYAWMTNVDDPDLMPHLEAENRYADACMRGTEELQAALYKEMRGRMKEGDETVPHLNGEWLYFNRTLEGKEYPVYCRRFDRPGSVEETILDLNALAAGLDYFAIGLMQVSPNGSLLAYTFDVVGDEKYILVVKDLRTGELLSTTAERVTALAWANDSETFFYTTEDDVNKRSDRLYRHKVGSDEHKFLHVEEDDVLQISVRRSLSGRFIFMETGDHTSATASCINADQPQSTFKEILPLKQMVRYDFEDDGGENFYILTNDWDAIDYFVVKAPCGSPASWQTILPHRRGVTLFGMTVLADHLIVHEREHCLPKVRVQKISTGEVHYVFFPEPVYDVEPEENHEFHTSKYRLTYESMVTPPATFECDLNAGTTEVLKTEEVIGYDATAYNCKRIFATAEDGTQVPISLVFKGDLVPGGPLLLYGYGAYGYAMTPYFSDKRLSLLDRGVVFAIAHVRGGGEGGEQWWLDGKLKVKMHTFTDFISCARRLIDAGYTTKKRLAIEGRSAGGLLIGAVLNLAPDLFRAAVLGVPFVDLLNTMLKASLPLTTGEYGEWGNPNFKEDFQTMWAYSPFDNIVARDYSAAILVRSSFKDPRVSFWEPVKWAAKMRATRTDGNPTILKMRLKAGGHFGGSGRFDALEDIAFDYAFILTMVGAN